MIAEAIDTAVTLGWAFAAWLVLTSLAATAALYAVIAVVWWVVRAAVRGVKAARNALRARLASENPPRVPPEPQDAHDAPRAHVAAHAPSWAHTQPHDTEEAA